MDQTEGGDGGLKEHSHKSEKRSTCYISEVEAVDLNLKSHFSKVQNDIKKKSINDTVCELCDKSFFNESSMKRHMKEIHKSQEDPTCELCRKIFSSKQALKFHSNTRHNTVNFNAIFVENTLALRKIW